MTEKHLFDLIIIGAGSAGLSLASGAAQLGLQVALIEGEHMGGDCLNTGCIPSKSLLAAAKSIHQAKFKAPYFGADITFQSVDFGKVMAHVASVIDHIKPHDSVERFESLGVRVFRAHAKFIDKHTIKAGDDNISAKKFVIATGSSPIIPPIDGLDAVKYLTNETIFDITTCPSHLIVVGGGPIGCELAQAFAMLGSQVTIIEALSLLSNDDEACVDVVRQSLIDLGVNIREQTNVQKVFQQDGEMIRVLVTNDSEKIELTGSHILIATGRKANIDGLGLDSCEVRYNPKGIAVNWRLQTSQKHIYAIGDVVGPYQFTHMASYQASVVLKNIVFKWPAKVNYQASPWVTYTSPELAHVGMSAREAKNRADLQVTTWPFERSDRAQTENETKGMIKVTTNRRGQVVAATIVGAHAGELIMPWVMAIQQNKTLKAFTDMIVPYPTFSEISKHVSGEFYRPKVFSKKVRTIVSWLQKLWW